MKPRLFVKQEITFFANRYAIYQINENGSTGKMVAFAQQKRLAFKERVDFYSDSSKQSRIFTMRAEKVMDVHGKYFVEDENGNTLGAFRKEFAKSLINSTWNIFDSNSKPALTVSESNQFLALARRFAGWIPIIGGLLDMATTLLRYHFSFQSSDGTEVGMYVKITLLRDHYRLDMTDDAYTSQDWRIFAAFAVALDALQSR